MHRLTPWNFRLIYFFNIVFWFEFLKSPSTRSEEGKSDPYKCVSERVLPVY